MFFLFFTWLYNAVSVTVFIFEVFLLNVGVFLENNINYFVAFLVHVTYMVGTLT